MSTHGITKEEFIKFEIVRQYGPTNMFDTNAIVRWSAMLTMSEPLTRKQVNTIRAHYDELEATHPEVRRCNWKEGQDLKDALAEVIAEKL